MLGVSWVTFELAGSFSQNVIGGSIPFVIMMSECQLWMCILMHSESIHHFVHTVFPCCSFPAQYKHLFPTHSLLELWYGSSSIYIAGSMKASIGHGSHLLEEKGSVHSRGNGMPKGLLQLLCFADRWCATSDNTAAVRLRSSGKIDLSVQYLSWLCLLPQTRTLV
jgi:hypothetical protein